MIIKKVVVDKIPTACAWCPFSQPSEIFYGMWICEFTNENVTKDWHEERRADTCPIVEDEEVQDE